MFRRVFSTSLALSLLIALFGVLPARAAEPVFADLAEPYEAIRLQLLTDATEGVAPAAEQMQGVLAALQENFSAALAGVSARDAETLKGLLPAMLAALESLAQAADEGDLQGSRDAFYELSKPVVRYHTMVEEKAGMVAVYCPMARRSWLQAEGAEIGNPYHGQAMAGCGNVVGG